MDLFPPDEIEEDETVDSLRSGASGNTQLSMVYRSSRARFGRCISGKPRSTTDGGAFPRFVTATSSALGFSWPQWSRKRVRRADGLSALITFGEEKGNQREHALSR
jgi:hypothetical protein